MAMFNHTHTHTHESIAGNPLFTQSFSKDKIYNERSYTFQICSEDHEEEREDWVQKVKRAATQHVRSRMRTRTRANGGAAGSNNSLMVGDRSSRRNASSNDSSQNGGGTKGVESRKIVAIGRCGV